jgi:hypothetical protein
MNLVSYSSSDSDSDEQKSQEIKNDRIRLFPHEDGNWALSIYTFGMT